MYNNVTTGLQRECSSDIILASRRWYMSTAKKQETFGGRISSEHKNMLKYAADCMGQDLTSYIVSTALERAKKDIKEYQEMQSLVLSKSDFSKVVNEIESPSEPNTKLVDAFRKNKSVLEDE